MFQIVQGMYFRPVPLTNTTHRQVYYTNLSFQRNVIVDAPFGRLLPSTEFNGIHTLTVEAKEQLETIRPDGTPEILVATGGDQLLDEIADVVSFCLNAVCVRDLDMARRLVATAPGARFGPSAMLRQTFDASRHVSVEELTFRTASHAAPITVPAMSPMPPAHCAMAGKSIELGSGMLVIVAIRNGHIEDGPVEREEAEEAEYRVDGKPGRPGP